MSKTALVTKKIKRRLLNMEFDQEILNSFCDEAIDLLVRWEQVCFELKKNNDKEHFEELFRIAHNIKGGSRSVGLVNFGDFVHKIEDGITLLRDQKVQLTENILTLLFDAQKILNDWAVTAKLDATFNPDFSSFINKYTQSFQVNQSLDATIAAHSEKSVDSSLLNQEAAVENKTIDTSEKKWS